MADSTNLRNAKGVGVVLQAEEALGWGVPAERLSGPGVQLSRRGLQFFPAALRQIRSFGEMLPEQPFVFSFDPRCQGAMRRFGVSGGLAVTVRQSRTFVLVV